jgi:Fe-Mn family superoxide dismutase
MATEAHTLTPDHGFGVFNQSAGRFVLPSLPFETHALSPITGEKTLEVHLTKHHQAYIDGANGHLDALAKQFDTPQKVVAFARQTEHAALLEMAGQALNHAFFWTCQQAAGLTRPVGALEAAIAATYGDFDGFVAAAKALGKSRIGSGWIWLVADKAGGVGLRLTTDAGCLLDDADLDCLLVCDIWEHAYYLDHFSDRAAWIAGFFTQIADWPLAQTRYEGAVAKN